jgi:hypothetical protein
MFGMFLFKAKAAEQPVAPVEPPLLLESPLSKTAIMGTLEEYFYKPAMATFTNKNVMRMEIDQLCKLLTEKIKLYMDDFIRIGTEAKQMKANGAKDTELREKHKQMADIFFTLRPAEPVVRMMYPKMCPLFDQLIELREQLDYSIAETKVIVNEPVAKKGWF